MKNNESLISIDINKKLDAKGKSKFNYFTSIFIAILFLSISLFSIFYIAADKKTIDENLISAPLAQDVFLPDFIPNSVKYQSTEPVRVYKKILTEKEMIFQKERQRKIDAVSINAMPKLSSDIREKTSQETISAPVESDNKTAPSSLKLSTKCYVVTKPEIFPIESSGFSSENGNQFSYWTGKNNTDKTVAISFSQNGRKIAVSFIPPRSELTTKLPASNIRFGLMQSENKCIVWGVGSELISLMPSRSSDGIHNPYVNAVFESLFFVNNYKYEFKTNFLGMAEN